LAEVTGTADYSKKSVQELEEMLHQALGAENYERASQIRDELNKRRSA